MEKKAILLPEAGCKSRLLFGKIAMAIWFQLSAVRFQVSGVGSKKRIS